MMGKLNGKQVLITGGLGFVALNLIEKLLENNVFVNITLRHLNYDRLDYFNNIIKKYNQKVNVEITDMQNYIETYNILKRIKPYIIFDLAGNSIVQDSAGNPLETVNNNIIKTTNILEAARQLDIMNIIYSSTDKIYGNYENTKQILYKENDSYRALDIYASTKCCSDILCQTYNYQYNMNILITRSANIFGEGDFNISRIFPKTILNTLTGNKSILYEGSKKILRDYIYIKDIVRAYILLAENIEKYFENNSYIKGEIGYNVFNLSTGYKDNILSAEDIINKIHKYVLNNYEIQAKGIEIQKKSKYFIEAGDSALDNTKIEKMGFIGTKIDDGILKTIKWYKENMEMFK